MPLPPIVVGALRENDSREKRVAISPPSAAKLIAAGITVLVEPGAGSDSWYADVDYTEVGVRMLSAPDIVLSSDVIACVEPPPGALIDSMRSGQFLVGMLHTESDHSLTAHLQSRGIVGLDLDRLPRTLSSAQSMDALTSQASIAGYRAATLAATTYGRLFPMMMTAAGTVRPARVVVLGAGIAGLAAIGTARRLGAQVTGYDVRAESRSEVESLGAQFLDVAVTEAAAPSTDGYARELTAGARDGQQAAIGAAVAEFDVVITTAQVFGRRAPVLVTADAIAQMRPGSVVIDLAACSLGGNVEGSIPETTWVTTNGVTVIGAAHLASTMPAAASTAYARNVCDLLLHLVSDGELVIDPGDPIATAVVVRAVAEEISNTPVRLDDPIGALQ